MIIAGLWRYGDWRHVATGCNALVLFGGTVGMFLLKLQLSLLIFSGVSKLSSELSTL